jgi:hypothetical protein
MGGAGVVAGKGGLAEARTSKLLLGALRDSAESAEGTDRIDTLTNMLKLSDSSVPLEKIEANVRITGDRTRHSMHFTRITVSRGPSGVRVTKTVLS